MLKFLGSTVGIIFLIGLIVRSSCSKSSSRRAGECGHSRSDSLSIAGRGRRPRGRRRRRDQRPARRTARRRPRHARSSTNTTSATSRRPNCARPIKRSRRADQAGARAFRLLRRRGQEEPDRRRRPSGWKATFTMTPGEPAIVRRRASKSRARARSSAAWRNALAGFVPKVGERLDHATYEASKAVIDTSLRGAGYLDAKIHAAARDGEARRISPRKSISRGRAGRATSSATCASRAMRRSRKNSCASSSRGAKTRTSTPSRCSTCSSAWWMPTTSSWCRCSRRSTRRKTARCRSTCC